MRPSFRAALACSALFVLCVMPPRARACGGLFCSQGGTPTTPPEPVYQAGEKILFSVDPDGTVVAMVQIAYTGPSSSFAWIVPVVSLPEVSIGSPELLDLVDTATAPYYGTDTGGTEGTCATACPPGESRSSGSGGAGCGFGFGAPASSGSSFYVDAGHASSDAGAPDGTVFDGLDGVHVDSRSEIGPYEVAVLTGTDVSSVVEWLSGNGYVVPDGTSTLLAPYVAAHDHFVALRLRKDATTGELVPLVLRYVGEPCIPIRLTQVATVDDLPITAFFLSDADMRSTNYLETELGSPRRLFVPGVGVGTYQDVLSTAVDDAGGHAFVREYAGPTPATRLTVATLDDLRTIGSAPGLAAALRTRIGIDDALAGAFARVLPPPDGVSPTAFLTCIASTTCTTYDAYLRTVAFHPADIVDAIESDVLAPRRAANYMLADHPRLTRLTTTLSASEMTLDPEFARMPPRDVSNRHVALFVRQCSSAYFEDSAPLIERYPTGGWDTVYVGVSRSSECYATSTSSHGCCEVAGTGVAVGPLGVAWGVAVIAAWARRRRKG